ncbi:MAG: sialate O-acetylesterase [Planctomycetota bacterium]
MRHATIRGCQALATVVTITLLISLCTGTATAAVEPAALFSDNAVLQADREVPVWGWDTPGQAVTVTVGQAKVTGTADKDGRWEVRLPAMKAAEAALEMTIAGTSTVVLKNILVGEVWLGSGQSNMAMPVDWGVFGAWGSPECMKQVGACNHPKLRIFKVEERLVGDPPAKNVRGSWQMCTPTTVLKWSAAGFFFARDLQKELGGTPVGIINSSVGGTQIAWWSNRKAIIELNPSMNAQVQQRWENDAKKMEDFDKQVVAWQAAGGKTATKPKRPVAPWPSSLYNGMIAPLMPYAIRGIAWYQGESNTGTKVEDSYAKTLEALITTWRAGWKQGEIPFVVVQLPNFGGGGQYSSPTCKPVQVDPVEEEAHWPPLREAQRRVVAGQSNTALLVAIDIGDEKNVHPVNKAELGRRWALLAMQMAYGKKDAVVSGPVFAGCTFKDGKAVATFTTVGGGLTAKGDGEIKGFAIAGKDGKFVWAKAVIDGATVVLSSDAVKEPTAIRYAWAENPIGNLINTEGFPAGPFKNDGVVAENK